MSYFLQIIRVSLLVRSLSSLISNFPRKVGDENSSKLPFIWTCIPIYDLFLRLPLPIICIKGNWLSSKYKSSNALSYCFLILLSSTIGRCVTAFHKPVRVLLKCSLRITLCTIDIPLFLRDILPRASWISLLQKIFRNLHFHKSTVFLHTSYLHAVEK